MDSFPWWLSISNLGQGRLLAFVFGDATVAKEGSFEYLSVARKAVERYGRPEAYYVDRHKIFRFVEHRGVHRRYLHLD